VNVTLRPAVSLKVKDVGSGDWAEATPPNTIRLISSRNDLKTSVVNFILVFLTNLMDAVGSLDIKAQRGSPCNTKAAQKNGSLVAGSCRSES
jgi:hypothetical protein